MSDNRKQCPKCRCMNNGRKACVDCGFDLTGVTAEPPISAGPFEADALRWEAAMKRVEQWLPDKLKGMGKEWP